MKPQLLLTPIIFFALVIGFTACEDSGTGPENDFQVETHTITDIPADTTRPYTDITYYSLRENTIVEDTDSASTQWDIAFSGTTIYTNSGSSGPGEGGALVLDVAFDDLSIAPSEGYETDTDTLLAIPTGSDNGWYHYTNQQEPQHAVLPLENKTIVLKTADGNYYAKLNILSWYKDNPDTSTEEFANMETRPTGSMYTFEYAIQLNGSREFVE